MPVMNPSLCIGTQTSVYLAPREKSFTSNGMSLLNLNTCWLLSLQLLLWKILWNWVWIALDKLKKLDLLLLLISQSFSECCCSIDSCFSPIVRACFYWMNNGILKLFFYLLSVIGNSQRRYPTSVSMQRQPWSQSKFPSLQDAVQPVVVSKNKRPVFACNSALVGSIHDFAAFKFKCFKSLAVGITSSHTILLT